MRKLLLISMLVSSMAVSHTHASETVFFESLYDVPVMAGLSEISELGMTFDKVEGRLAYAVADPQNIDKKSIISFYNKALPQMGWKKSSSSIFTREDEKLVISFDLPQGSQGRGTLVKFTLSPIED